jgi:hypothetical protein
MGGCEHLLCGAAERSIRIRRLRLRPSCGYADTQEHLVPEGEEHQSSAHDRRTSCECAVKAWGNAQPAHVFENSAKQYEGSVVGSEALFHLGEALERAGEARRCVEARMNRWFDVRENSRMIPGRRREGSSW